MPPARPASPFTGTAILGGLVLLATSAWLVSRVWLGVCFTDEMLYYGEIAGLVRTGRLFQDDLAVQQLGYFFVLPFFKLHALIQPDQSYLILFGRLLLLAAYGTVGAIFWRAATRLGGFSSTQKILGLGAFAAWVPFQIFAFSYNATSYLLSVVLVGVWLTRKPEKNSHHTLTVAALLTVLTYTYPPAGLMLILAAGLEAGRRLGWRRAGELLAATALLGGGVLALIAWRQGAGFLSDLQATVAFSRSFSVASTLVIPERLANWVALLAAAGCFLWRQRLGRAFRYPFGMESAPLLRWAALAAFVIGGGLALNLALNGSAGHAGLGVYVVLLMILASSVTPTPGATWFGRALTATLAVGCAALLLVSLSWSTGYYAMAVFFVLQILLTVFPDPGAGTVPARLVSFGTITGSAFTLTSSNGVHNFGVGAAGVIPFLFLYATRAGHRPEAGWIRRLAGPALPILAGLWLLNGILTPYGEQPVWQSFQPIRGVPAFKGLWTSPVKIEAIERFRALSSPGLLQGKRLLVIGPQPWLYFVLGGQPATPMFFMLYAGRGPAYEEVASRLFRQGMPDAIMLTDLHMPVQIGAKVTEWSRQAFTVRQSTLPADFIDRFKAQVSVGFSPEVFLLSRPPVASTAPAPAEGK